MRDSIAAIVAEVPGEIGVAVIVNGKDTVTVNDADIYPMMSVFKLHQAVASCHWMHERGIPLDTAIRIDRNDLDPDTWSPMLKENTAPFFKLTVRDLLEYALIQSDNNASNLLFDRFASVAETDSFITTLLPAERFRIAVSEADMKKDHQVAYANHSSALATAVLMDRLFNDSIIDGESQTFICDALRRCKTGVDRISAPFAGTDDVVIAHKTGSGYVNSRGELVAHNDAAHITLPDGISYIIVVFVKDFAGDEKKASGIISHISRAVYDFLR
ncbi:MAG: serine hydrolase [Bacteroidales bacterium]|nr:serine hydrolase [Bacteroidales bacterium]